MGRAPCRGSDAESSAWPSGADVVRLWADRTTNAVQIC